MAAQNFEPALSRLLRDEGGYGNHPSDPGGPTNFGITLADARRYWKANATARDVKAMPASVAKDIYRKRYWDALRCDDLPAGVDYAVFDYGVNSGVARSGKVLRRKLGLPESSSAVTEAVISAATRTDAAKLVGAICAERLAFLKSLKTYPVFGRGWSRRVASVETAACQMVRMTSASTPRPKVETPSGTTFLGALVAWWRGRTSSSAKGRA